MKKAWIENDTIRDIAAGDPAEQFHPDVAAFYDTDVPDEAQQGWRLIEGEWAPLPVPQPDPDYVPSEPEPSAPASVNIPVPHFKLRFTAQERVAFTQASTDSENPVAPYIADWLKLLDDQRLDYVTIGDPNLAAALDMLVGAGLLSEERKAAVLA